jgi:hypothetical protein
VQYDVDASVRNIQDASPVILIVVMSSEDTTLLIASSRFITAREVGSA